MAQYKVIPERLYMGSEYDIKHSNPDIFLPKKWQFLKVETTLKRSKKWKPGAVPLLDDAGKAAAFVADVLKGLDLSDRERVYSVFLDSALQVLGIHEVTVGSAKESLAPPKELFRAAILANANAMIVAHNHPSGTLKFSEADNLIMQRLRQVGGIVGVQLMDFIIIGIDGDYLSAQTQGRL